MGNTQSINNNTVHTHRQKTSTIGNMLQKPIKNDAKDKELFHSDTIVDTLGWQESENMHTKSTPAIPNALDNFIKSRTYFSEPDSSVTEYVVTDLKGGYDDDDNEDYGWNSEDPDSDNSLDLIGGAETNHSISTNYSEITKIRKFIENDIQQGGGDTVCKGTRTLKGGRNKMDSDDDDDEDNKVSAMSSESGHIFSESSDTNVYMGYRMK